MNNAHMITYLDTTAQKVVPPKTPQEEGEESVSGHMPDPESDDSVDEQTRKVGLYGDTEEAPEEVDVAEEVEEAEQSRHR